MAGVATAAVTYVIFAGGGAKQTVSPATHPSSVTGAPTTPSVSAPAGPPRIADFYMTSTTEGMAIEDARPGGVITTTDGGRSWVRVGFPASVVPAQFYAFDRKIAWAFSRVGQTIQVYRTTDAGAHWAASAAMDGGVSATDPLFVLDPVHGWIGVKGAGGPGHEAELTLTHTVDGGSHWPTNSVLTPASDDSGAGSAAPGTCELAVGFRDANVGFAGGSHCNGPYLLGTHDAGRSWRRQQLPAPPYRAQGRDFYTTGPPLFSSARDGTLVVSAGFTTGASAPRHAAIYITHDGGQTWSPHLLPATPLRTDFRKAPDFWMVGGLHGVSEGRDVGFYHSPDGGLSWARVTTTIGFEAESIEFEDRTHGWALGRFPSDGSAGDLLLFTSDGGQTWTDLHPRLP